MTESSKIAIYSVASYAWNPAKYDTWQTWKDAIRTILPSAAEELECFAMHNSDLGLTDMDTAAKNLWISNRLPNVS